MSYNPELLLKTRLFSHSQWLLSILLFMKLPFRACLYAHHSAIMDTGVIFKYNSLENKKSNFATSEQSLA